MVGVAWLVSVPLVGFSVFWILVRLTVLWLGYYAGLGFACGVEFLVGLV